ncbi:hypothetical protein HanIR_Chr17g0887481 [Helianthus annuus]|nr:hypothetical protein HanIR_Chr17g0887481 [Helianthus annuus]
MWFFFIYKYICLKAERINNEPNPTTFSFYSFSKLKTFAGKKRQNSDAGKRDLPAYLLNTPVNLNSRSRFIFAGKVCRNF